MEVPETRFAVTSDAVRIAYQAFGEGPPVVMVPGLVSNAELNWEHELTRRVLEYEARHVRVVLFDKRGIGCSDRFEEPPTLEQRIGDISAVMDAEGLERASVLGLSEGGVMSQFFAATCPERVDRLVLVESDILDNQVSFDDRYDGHELASIDKVLWLFERVIDSWGVDPRFFVEWFCPSQRDNEGFVRWAGRWERLSATRDDIARQIASFVGMKDGLGPETLDRIVAPTLVMHMRGDRVAPVAAARLVAGRIRGAEYREFDGIDHFAWVAPNWRELVDCVIEFVTGRPVAGLEPTRRFAVVLFTDIVDSTRSLSDVGDVTWRETLDRHDRIAWKTTDDHRGHIVRTTGDGLLATFDSPSAATHCAAALRRELAAIGVDIRAGLHAGEIEVRDETEIAGLAVHVAARVEQAAAAGQVLMSGTMRDLLLGTDIGTEDAGEHTFKGVDGQWRLHALR
jgi:class 3 adenylate cyclase